MTKKDDLQQELLEKVKPGTKPSHLKRSKSADDIGPPKPPPLPLTNPSELAQLKKENNQLKTELQEVQARLKDLHDFAKNSPAPSANPTTELKKQTDLNALLQEQLKEKQQQIEELEKKELQSRFNSLREPELTDLDQALIARHQNLKDWFKQYGKTQQLDLELTENIEEASECITEQDKRISSLQSQVVKLKKTNQSLQKDLDLAQKLAELRRNPPYSVNPDTYPFLKYALYSLAVAVFAAWLVKSVH